MGDVPNDLRGGENNLYCASLSVVDYSLTGGSLTYIALDCETKGSERGGIWTTKTGAVTVHTTTCRDLVPPSPRRRASKCYKHESIGRNGLLWDNKMQGQLRTYDPQFTRTYETPGQEDARPARDDSWVVSQFLCRRSIWASVRARQQGFFDVTSVNNDPLHEPN